MQVALTTELGGNSNCKKRQTLDIVFEFDPNVQHVFKQIAFLLFNTATSVYEAFVCPPDLMKQSAENNVDENPFPTLDCECGCNNLQPWY